MGKEGKITKRIRELEERNRQLERESKEKE